MNEFWTIYLSVLAAEATYELLKWVGKLMLALRPQQPRDARGRFSTAKAVR